MPRGRGQKLKIDLYDTWEKKYELRDTGMPEAAKHLGVTYNCFTNARYRGGLVMGRYQIIKTGFLPSMTYLKEMEELDKEECKKSDHPRQTPIDFESRWDEAVKPFRIAYAEREKAER